MSVRSDIFGNSRFLVLAGVLAFVPIPASSQITPIPCGLYCPPPNPIWRPEVEIEKIEITEIQQSLPAPVARDSRVVFR